MLAVGLGAVLTGLAVAAPPAPAPEPLRALIAQAPLPGGCVARTRGTAVELQQAFGHADVVQRRPYTVDTWQPIGSVSKTVIGLTLAQLAERGVVDLDAPLARHLGWPLHNPAHPGVPITLRQLATHTGGIVDSEAGYQRGAYETGRGDPQRPRQALGDYLAAYLRPGGRLYQPGHFAPEPPGTRFRYSNVGSALAAQVLAQASGQPFERLSTEQLLQPLGLRDSAWFMPAERAPQRATLYGADRRALPPYLLATYPDGGLRSTCADLTRLLQAWAAALDGQAPAPLTASALRAALTPQFAPGRTPPGLSTREPNQGLFFAVRQDGSVGHTGSDEGVTVFLFLDPVTRVGRLFMTNIDIGADPALPPRVAALWRALGD
jgi:CubicO group peptidase (beta-lactamase class C family)